MSTNSLYARALQSFVLGCIASARLQSALVTVLFCGAADCGLLLFGDRELARVLYSASVYLFGERSILCESIRVDDVAGVSHRLSGWWWLFSR